MLPFFHFYAIQVPKTDKLTILVDAIKLLGMLRQQNYQLRELNKYLQERVAKYESSNHYQIAQALMGGTFPRLTPVSCLFVLVNPTPGPPGSDVSHSLAMRDTHDRLADHPTA